MSRHGSWPDHGVPGLQVEKDEEYIKSVTALGAVIEDLVKANNAVDIYEEYFAGKVLLFSACHCRCAK